MAEARGGRDKGEPAFKPDTLVEHFRVVRLLGRGGMGDVYLARDIRLGRKVALKVVRPPSRDARPDLQRFLLEARTTARFSHPNIVTVYAVGVHENHPYLALEYLDGENLRERLKGGRLSLKETIRTGIAVAEALDEAHLHKVFHRDLKPENVLIPRRDGRPRVVDFGLAEIAAPTIELDHAVVLSDDAREVISQAESIDTMQLQQQVPRGPQGTPPYMAPEQWLSQPATAATDIWALGVMLFELLMGRRPFVAGTTVHLAAIIVSPQPAPRVEGIDGVPHELSELVARCLDKTAENRPNAREVATQLDRLLVRERTKSTVEQAPFRGLETFGETHAGLFFGRDEELAAFMEVLREEPVLPVVGPSGAGKSSFVQAAVIPRLREQSTWRVLQLRPGSAPFRTLAARCEEMLKLAGEHTASLLPTMDVNPAEGTADTDPSAKGKEMLSAARKPETLDEQIRRHPQFVSLILERLAARLRCRVLLFVDQLEELYTLVDDEAERRTFMEALCTAADDPLGPNRVIFTLREDFLGRVAGSPSVRDALGHVTLLRTPEPAALEQILLKPLREIGYAFEDPTLVQEMIAAAGREQASLPLLQFAARTLWDHRDSQRKLLTRKAYTEMGGVAGALAAHADGVLEALTEEDVGLVRELLLRMVTPDGTRRVLSEERVLEGLPDRSVEILQRLVKARLVTSRKSRGSEGGATELELVHESLIRTWGRLARWIDRSREDLAFLDEVQQAAELWARRGYRDDEVWQGEALREALRSLEHCTAKIPDLSRRFLQVAMDKAKRRRRTKQLILGNGIVVVLAVIVGLLFLWLQAEKERRNARERLAVSLLEGSSAALARGDFLESRAKLRGSLETKDSEMGRALWRRLSRDPLLWKKEFGGIVYSAVFSPDGRKVAVVGQDSAVYLLDTLTREQEILRGTDGQMYSIAFSADGQLLATGAWSGKIFIHDLKAKKLRSWKAHKDSVWDLVFMPDGRKLVSCSKDGLAKVWSIQNGRFDLQQVLSRAKGATTGLAASPDGKRLASVGEDGLIYLWDPDHLAKPVRTLAGHHGQVMRVSFDSRGERLLTAGFDYTVRLWDVKIGQEIRVFRGHTSLVLAASFISNKSRIISAGYDSTIRLWDIDSGVQIRQYLGHESMVSSLSASPDGKRFVSSSRDRTVRLWNLGDDDETVIEHGHTEAIYGLSAQIHSTLIATGGQDQTVRIWDSASSRNTLVLRGHQERIRKVSLSSDGRRVASASYDRTVRIWHLDTGGDPRVIGGHRSAVMAVQISPDGTQVASGCNDTFVRIWDVENGRLLHQLAGHQNVVFDVAFDSKGQRLCSVSSDGTARLWDAQKGLSLAVLQGHQAGVYSAAFSPDDQSLATASIDGTVRIWDLQTYQSRIIQSAASRAYAVAYHPSGRMLAVARSDGIISMVDLASGASEEIGRHLSEANSVAFLDKGRLLASAGDDGTLKIWDIVQKRPLWRAPLMTTRPPRMLSHEGWHTPGASRSGHRPGDFSWVKAVEHRGWLGRLDAKATRLCLGTTDGWVQAWDLRRDAVINSKKFKKIKDLHARHDGCLVLADSGVFWLGTRAGQGVKVRDRASAIAADEQTMLVADEDTILELDSSAALKRTHASELGISALLPLGQQMLVGFLDGSIELLSLDGSAAQARTHFEDVPSSPAIRLIAGPAGTVLAGYANGELGLWQLSNGLRLEHARLHGPVVHLAMDSGKLYAATELGDHLAMDLGVFQEDYCRVLRTIWRDVPVVWENGLPMVRPAPREHACYQRQPK